MLKKSIFISLLSLLFIGSAGLIAQEKNGIENPMRTLNVHIAEDNDGVWRIRDNRGRGHGTIKAKKADQIFWTTRKSAMVFTFPKGVDAYFDFDEGMFEDGRSQRIEANKEIAT
ncbi:MAG: hypothetical protein U5K69_17210 [Balneolaceae bacterium]|nr:hypothetical protein [Balneolaceae bacterium]